LIDGVLCHTYSRFMWPGLYLDSTTLEIDALLCSSVVTGVTC